MRLEVKVLAICVGSVLVGGCSKPAPRVVPTLSDLSFVPLAKGISVFDGKGDLKTGRVDQFRVQRTYESACRLMRNAGWIEKRRDGFMATYERRKPPDGYAGVVVGVIAYAGDRSGEPVKGEWVSVTVTRWTEALKPEPASTRVNRNATQKRLDGIKIRLRAKESLLESDRQFLIRTAESTEGIEGPYSRLMLMIAAEQGQFPMGQVLEILERKVGDPQSREVFLNVTEYRAALKFGNEDEKCFDLIRMIEKKPSSISSLTELDRNAISYIMARPSADDRTLAARIFLPKLGLDVKSKKWLLPKILAERDKSRGRYRTYWDFVKRSFKARNRDPISPMS